MDRKRVLSGIRATGKLHLGNYLGAVKGMLELQNSNKYETFYMVADLHTLTTPYDKNQLKQSTREIIIDYLAAGLDPEKSVLFIQSHVSEHIELAYFFSTVTTVAKMQHLPTFKDKVKQYPENVTMALLNYPILMSADILVYKAGLVPVGTDQEPHLEVAREIARRFNQDYDTDFPEPKRFETGGAYVPSLTGSGKMSKTVEGSYINITDDFETIRKKIRSVPTSSEVGGKKASGVKVLFDLLALFDKNSYQEFELLFKNGSLRYVDLKDHIAKKIFEELKPLQENRFDIMKNPSYIDQVIQNGAEKARAIASQTLKEVKKKIGLF